MLCGQGGGREGGMGDGVEGGEGGRDAQRKSNANPKNSVQLGPEGPVFVFDFAAPHLAPPSSAMPAAVKAARL